MRLLDTDIIGARVETVRGVRLGKVRRIELDVESHCVARYWVRPSLFTRPFARYLLIGREQVVSLSRGIMIVEDLARKDSVGTHVKDSLRVPVHPSASPVAMSATESDAQK